jgi:hypothetical protein
MKRLFIAAAAFAALACSAVAYAGPSTSVSGQLTGTSEWQLLRASTWTIHGTFTSDSLGSGTYAGTVTTNHDILDASNEFPVDCFATNFVPCNSPQFVAGGSITFTTDKGATITTTIAPGSWVQESDTVFVIAYVFELNLDVTGGTRRYKHASGSLSLSYRTHTILGGFGCIHEPIPGLDFEICGQHYDGGTLTGTIGH